MKGIISEAENMRDEISALLCSELERYTEEGIEVRIGGYQASINKRLTDMLLRDRPCTYMRSYSFDELGRVTGVEFQCVRLDEKKY